MASRTERSGRSAWQLPAEWADGPSAQRLRRWFTAEGATVMRTLFNLWLARWQAALLVRSSDLITGLLTPWLAGAASGRGAGARALPVHGEHGHPEHHHGHGVEEHAVPQMWLLAPRTTLAIWMMAGAVALAHHLHLTRHSGAVLVIGIDRPGRRPAAGRPTSITESQGPRGGR